MGATAQWQSTFLASMRSWVQSPLLQTKQNNNQTLGAVPKLSLHCWGWLIRFTALQESQMLMALLDLASKAGVLL